VKTAEEAQESKSLMISEKPPARMFFVELDPKVRAAVLSRRAPGSHFDFILANLEDLISFLATRDLAPLEWADNDWIQKHGRDALHIAMRNPKAFIDAETLQREGMEGSPGEYIGLRSWDQLCSLPHAGERGYFVPCRDNVTGLCDTLVRGERLDEKWRTITRKTGASYGSSNPHAWKCARQILFGPPWVAELYRTGFGLWCWNADGDPKWVLIARDGEGLPWPELDQESSDA